MFDAVRGNPERDDEAMLAHVHAVEQQCHQVQVFETADIPTISLPAIRDMSRQLSDNASVCPATRR